MSAQIEPGGWGVTDEVSDDVLRAEVILTAELSGSDSGLGKATTLMIDSFGSPERVLYPGSGVHVIDQLFPDSEIVYVDPAESEIILASQSMGDRSRAVVSGVEDFSDDKGFDLLFSLNNHAPMDECLRLLNRGGFVFCNNYLGTRDAGRIIQTGECELVGVLVFSLTEDETEVTLVTDDLEKYLSQVDDGVSYYVFRKK